MNNISFKYSVDYEKGTLSMLILTRRVGETLMIGDDVTVTVLGVKGNQVHVLVLMHLKKFLFIAKKFI